MYTDSSRANEQAPETQGCVQLQRSKLPHSRETHLLLEVSGGEVVKEKVNLVLKLFRRVGLLHLLLVSGHQQGVNVGCVDGGGLCEEGVGWGGGWRGG